MPELRRAAIIGVGRGGCELASRLCRTGFPGFTYAVLDVERQVLKQSPIARRLLLQHCTDHRHLAYEDLLIGKAALKKELPGFLKLLSGKSLIIFIGTLTDEDSLYGIPNLAEAARAPGRITAAIVHLPPPSGASGQFFLRNLPLFCDCVLPLITPDRRTDTPYGSTEELACRLAAKVRVLGEFLRVPDFADVNLYLNGQDDALKALRHGGFTAYAGATACGKNALNRVLREISLQLNLSLQTSEAMLTQRLLLHVSCPLMKNPDTLIELLKELNATLNRQHRILGVHYADDPDLAPGSVAISALLTGLPLSHFRLKPHLSEALSESERQAPG